MVKRPRRARASVKHVRAEGKLRLVRNGGGPSLPARDVKNLELVPKAEFYCTSREKCSASKKPSFRPSAHDAVGTALHEAEVSPATTPPDEDFIDAIRRRRLDDDRTPTSPYSSTSIQCSPGRHGARRNTRERGAGKPPPARALTGSGLQHRLASTATCGVGRRRPRALGRRRRQRRRPRADRDRDNWPHRDLPREKGVWRTPSSACRDRANLPDQRRERAIEVTEKIALDAFLAGCAPRRTSPKRRNGLLQPGLTGESIDRLRLDLAERVPAASRSCWTRKPSGRAQRRALRAPGAAPTGSSGASLGGILEHARPREAALLRRQLPSARAAGRRECVSSLGGLDDEESWRPRRALRALPERGRGDARRPRQRPRLGAPRTLARAPPPALDASYELGRVAARSVRSVPGERAFLVRSGHAPPRRSRRPSHSAR